MNSKSTIVLIAFLSTAGCLAFGQVILPIENRNELISNMQDVVGNTEQEATDFSELFSPFVVRPDPDRIVEEVQGPVEIQEEVLPEVISDEIALDVISRRFKPDGSLIFGNRGILKLRNGETIEEGESFTAEIRGTTYIVEVFKVTGRGYTLKVGDAMVEKTFLKAVNLPGN